MSQNQNPVVKLLYSQNHASRIKKADICSYCKKIVPCLPSSTRIGFDCGSHGIRVMLFSFAEELGPVQLAVLPNASSRRSIERAEGSRRNAKLPPTPPLKVDNF